MSTIQERLQIKREPLDKWSVREQLCLASAVVKIGDQNWMSVSRALKPFGEPNRPLDWFHQKNCAAQYGSLLEHVETPKRKKRISGTETTVETPIETILRKLTKDRITELGKCLVEEKVEYAKLHEDMALLQSGNVSEELLDKWCKEMDEEEKQREEEAMAHTRWLKERELRKQEIERAWRPIGKPAINLPIKRKVSDSFDSFGDLEVIDENQTVPPQEMGKPALSPLLTSLLKSPSQVQNVANSSILHSAITSQRAINTTNSTIANLLNSTSGSNVSAALPQVVTTTIVQEQSVPATTITTSVLANDLLEGSEDTLTNIKVEDLESTILSSDDPLPEIKNEEVEVIISDLIQNADIVSDPEQHLQLDDNEDIITNLDNELQELCNEEAAAAAEEAAKAKEIEQKPAEKLTPKVDPFEFEEDPEIGQLTKLNSSSHTKYQDHSDVKQEDSVGKVEPQCIIDNVEDVKLKEKPAIQPGSVEIVEVVVMEETEVDKQLNKMQIQDIVHSVKVEVIKDDAAVECDEVTSESQETVKDSVSTDTPPTSTVFDEPTSPIDEEEKPTDCVDNNATTETNETSSQSDVFTQDYAGSFFDDVNMEVNKLDKSGKAKRDYSRTKKRESEKDFDILLAVEKAVNAQLEANDLVDDNLSDEKDYQENEKKFDITSLKPKIKIQDTDRSSSPWTEEEESTEVRSKRRYSTPATPSDSIPNSPASSLAYFDDDRDYKTWKKSVLLVYNRLITHKYSSLFLKPITDEQAPGYHSVVYRPMDLQAIRKNIDNGTIRTTLELQRDVLLMFTNAIMYNKTNQLVYNMAKQMQQESLQPLQILLQAQQGDFPQRRETRTSEPTKRKRTPEENIRNKKKKDD